MTFMPMTAHAGTGSAMQMGKGGIASRDTVYFGQYTSGNTYDVPWTVLGSSELSETNRSEDSSVLPMLSTYTLGTSAFRSIGTGYYPNSTLNTAMNGLYSNLFGDNEKSAVTDTTLTGDSMSSGESELTGQKLFPLSGIEGSSDVMIAKSITDPEGSAKVWWLRTSSDMSSAIEVVDTGSLDFNSVGGTLGVRPALNLNLSSVLFSSVAEGGKSTSVDGTMSAISSTTPSAWKLTLDDSANRSGFTVTETAMAAKQGDTKTITYSNANIGGREYVSAMITNSAGTEILYYGKLVHAQNIASGTADITIPSSLDAGTYSLKIFSEQCNGDKKTDLSSAFKNIALTVTAAPKAVGTTSATGTSCSHDYQWTVEKEPTETEDGEAAYKCTKCGHISARQPLTAYQYYVLESTNKIKNAKAGSTVTISSKHWNSFPKSFFEQVAKRRDITVNIQFPYAQKMYEITISPTQTIDTSNDKAKYYGPKYMIGIYKGTEVTAK